MTDMSFATKRVNDGVVTQIELTGDLICLASDNGKIQVFDKDGTERWTLEGHEGGVWALSAWGDAHVSGSTDNTARVWDLITGYVPSLIMCSLTSSR
jgi:F-box and WD-40 domain protein CDC4